MKLYSPKDLADENEHLTARWIRQHAESLGFKRIGKGRGKWLASRESIERALGECPTSKRVPRIGITRPSIAGDPFDDPLAVKIRTVLGWTKEQQVRNAKRREERSAKRREAKKSGYGLEGG